MSIRAILPPPLSDPDARDVVLGRSARIADYADNRAVLEGLSPQEIERISFYATVFGAEFNKEDNVAHWVGGAWPDEPASLTHAVARAIMDLEGTTSAATLAGNLPSIRARAWSQVLGKTTKKPLTRKGVPDAGKVHLQKLNPAYQGFFRFDLLRLRVPQFDGGIGDPIDRETYVGVDAAMVLAYDRARDTVLLVEQFRLGPWRRGDVQPWSLEPIAGLVDPGEDPAQTARREAHEEAGLVIDQVIPIGRGYASPGYSTDYFHMFLAYADLPTDAYDGRIGGALSEFENIRVHIFALERALAMCDSGEIDVVPLQMMLNRVARLHIR